MPSQQHQIQKHVDQDEQITEFYFGDRPRQVAIWTPVAKQQRLADEEAKRVAGLSWWRRWLEQNCR